MDNLEEYQTPEIYEAEYGNFQQDFNFFIGLTKRKGTCLDLACGTGRLTIALARAGFSCIGIDASKSMLEYAKKKSTGFDIIYKRGDMKKFQLDRKFDLITLAGNAFQALLSNEDQLSLLHCVKAHLKPKGIFAFNTRNATPDNLRTTNEYEYWHSFIAPKDRLIRVYGKQIYDIPSQTVHYITKRIWIDKEIPTDIKLRFTNSQELITRLDQHGFEIIHLVSDFNCKPFNREHSDNIIAVCKLKA